MKELSAPIKAVICMDMIGYNREGANRTYEIHACYYNKAIRNSCQPLAHFVVECAKSLNKLGEAQIYKGLSWGIDKPDSQDRDKYDPAIERSDHWSFQSHAFRAIVISEDLFVNDPTRGDPENEDSNPNYHRYDDTYTSIDPLFAADIASAVISAAKLLAQR
jgi:hypothetical protein